MELLHQIFPQWHIYLDMFLLGLGTYIYLRISKKIKTKKKNSKIIFDISRICKFCSVKSIKLLSMNVKRVKKPTNNVIKKIKVINIFFLIKSIIIKFNYLY